MTPAKQRLEVFCGEDHVGTFQRRSASATFDYDYAWCERPGATPISWSMPLTATHHTNRVVTPWLWGLLPDNDAVLNRWGRQFSVSTSHPFGLLEHVGCDVPGAMRLIGSTEGGAFGAKAGADEVEWLSEADVSSLLAEVRKDHTAWLGHRDAGRWSLAGAQAKVALLYDNGRWGRPSGTVPTTHILKPSIAGLSDHDLNEHLCLRAAAVMGMRVVSTSIRNFNGERAIVVERYDRIQRPDGQWERVHQEDLCQALAVHPGHKYESDGGPSVADVAGLLRRAMDFTRSEAAVRSFLDTLAFNWLIAGTDSHAKNHALLLSGAQVRLAPSYDVASALPYDYRETKTKLAMKVGDHYRLDRINRSSWCRSAQALGLDPAEAVDRVALNVSRVADAFSTAAFELDSDLSSSATVPALVDAVARRVERCTSLLA